LLMSETYSRRAWPVAHARIPSLPLLLCNRAYDTQCCRVGPESIFVCLHYFGCHSPKALATERTCVELHDLPSQKPPIALHREARNSQGRRVQLTAQACVDQEIVATLTIPLSSENLPLFVFAHSLQRSHMTSRVAPVVSFCIFYGSTRITLKLNHISTLRNSQ
jgi:hypothetical protein